MMIFQNSYRVIQIIYISLKYGLDEVLLKSSYLKVLKFFLYLNPSNWCRRRLPYGERLALALQELGPIYVKFGQLLSFRRDILPDDVAEALSCLQSQVEPFSSELAKRSIERALGQSIETAFLEFDLTPLAAASIAQVHAAVLHSGQRVIVKVLRPQIEKRIRRDIRLLKSLAHWLPKFHPDFYRFRPLEVVKEMETTLMDELDLLREAANANAFRRHFQHSEQVYIPEVIWPYCRPQVLVMERIDGIPIGDIAALKAAGIDLKQLAQIGVEMFYTQAFGDGFFHADLHPGNIFIDARNPQHPKYMLVDFGIVGSLSPEDQHYLAANFLAFFKRDYRRVAKLHIDSGWIPADTRIEQFESAMRTVSEPLFDRPLKDISLGMTLMRLFQIAKRFHMEIQPELLLLQKTIFNMESLGRYLYPELDIWESCRPHFERWMKKQVGFRGLMKRFQAELPWISEHLPQLPHLIYKALKRAETPHVWVKPRKTHRFLAGIGVGIGLALIAFAGVILNEGAPLAHVLTLGGGGVLLSLLGISVKEDR